MLLYTFRGVSNRELTCELAAKIAVIEGLYLREHERVKRILLAGDHRISTEMLKSALSAGFLSVGLDVVDCGMAPSSTLAFMVKRLGVPGVMITASHNPPEWNGLQFLEADSHIYGPDREERIKEEITRELSLPSWREIGTIRRETADIEGHLGVLRARVNPSRKLSVVADLGGGMAVLAVPRLLEMLGAEFEVINGELDPFFRGRPSEPRPEYLGELSTRITAVGADVGFAYDGDADRFVVVDETGRFVEGDKIMLLLCRHMFAPGPIVLNASTSMVAENALADDGFTIFRARWGQTFSGRRVRDQGALFGGEPDGHYIYPELSLRADGIASTAFFYDLLSRSESSLSEMLSAFRNTVMINEKIEWERDLARFRSRMVLLGEQFAEFQVLHKRLFVMTSDHSKLAVRQSPFDGTLRIFAESYEEDRADGMVRAVKEMLLD